ASWNLCLQSFGIAIAIMPKLLFQDDFPLYEVVHPTRVDAKGHFLSNFLSHHARRLQRRDASVEPAELDRIFYQFWHGGHCLHFNLTLNPHLLAPGFLTERRFGGLKGAQIKPAGSSQCHFLGEVWGEATVKGSASISTCDGLTGLFKLTDEEFFIQPLETSSDESSAPQAHAIYKRHVSPPSWSPVIQPISGKQAFNSTCGIKDYHQSFKDIERQRERWERRQLRRRRRRRIHQRSVSKEKWVETLVVADPKMVDYHGHKAVENYILAVMNIVAGLYRDASIGNPINIVVVRLILLEKEEDDLKITHHADNSLNSFCKWQKKLNMKGDEHPLHHDVAVLLTRKDICATINTPCETLGLSHVAGICQPHRSCSISEDTGLPLAFTVAHELGHNFGIQHDGNGNDCEPVGKRPFVMSPQLLYGTSVPRWSRCSRQYITRFLDRGWGWCLDDAPGKDKLSLSTVLPGVLYSALHQCRLQYGSASLLCDDMDNVCSTLWCTVGTTCRSKLDGAVDGTSCGEDKWCFSGQCVAVGFYPESINGGWASWSQWSACSRTCGVGVQSAERECDNPVPRYRGKYCLGERRRYKICNTAPCLHSMPSFRDIQCSHFNSQPYKGKFYKWEAVVNTVSPCELHCRPLNEHFSEKMRDAVVDGTPCYEGNKSRDICINGICKSIGCDYVIDSTVVEDRCGVCNGNGSTCTTVRRTFEESEGLGYVDIGLIPEGSWDIRIEELADAGNFLALRGDNPGKYFLNGGWTIQWNGEYKAAGTVFTYERTGQLENLTSPGPTTEPLWIQLLFQETNPGVRYEYTINQNVSDENNTPLSVFYWKYGSWTECSVTCGTGVQRQIVYCVEKTTGIVEEHFCDPLTRLDNNQTSCNKDPCPAIWWVGEWEKCSASCGSSGQTKRTVLCIQALSAEEQKALEPSNCEHIPKPESLSSCNTHIPCPAEWTTGSWSKCSLSCGSGVRHRNVTCSRNTGADCDPRKKPLSVTTCYIQDCPQIVDNFGGFDWSGSGWSSKEVLNEINPIPEVKPPPKYGTTRDQPRTDNDLNIVEGDFHYHNNIENIDHSQDNYVQVDDFYYDYNFINFHEDLSDLSDSEDSHSLSFSQEAEPTRVAAHMETTTAPAATSAIIKAISYTLKAEDPQNTRLNIMKDSKNTATKEVLQANSENLDDYLSEDFLLPVSTTHSPLLSTTQQSLKEKHRILWLPENISEVPKASTSLTGTAIIPPTQFSPADFPIATMERIPSNSASTETTGTYSTSQAALFDLANSDYSEIVDPPVRSINSDPGPSYQVSTSSGATPQRVTAPVQDLDSPTPTMPFLPTHLPAQTSVYAQVTTAAYWIAGNWSDCSTTCGLGAIWRTLTCSTGSQADCDPAKRPAPAQRCYLRPCSTWKVGEWSKCSKNCEGGIKLREVQCFDLRDQRPLRPFHCRAMSSRPQTKLSCNLQPCLEWYTSSWGQCSEVCGGGQQQRIVTCPEEDQCDRNHQPSTIQSCNSHPCDQWLTGSWGQCSASCGGGVRHRLIKCVDTRAETDGEVDQAQCNYEPQPESTQKCNTQECESAPPGAVCLHDRLTFRFCQTLRWLGRCRLPNVQAQCCKTCSQRSRSSTSRS
uniref:ADAM metallopeptidase with thrombospondin type 1 motif 7 n=1 Tax=Amphilophus citrinellus TaxID=61819 RepID=A0A3Q0SHJ4_AMPCI